MEPSWPVENGYVVEIDGLPSVRSRIAAHPEDGRGPDFGINTVMPAIHAIEDVVAAPPGIVLANALPLRRRAGVTRVWGLSSRRPGGVLAPL